MGPKSGRAYFTSTLVCRRCRAVKGRRKLVYKLRTSQQRMVVWLSSSKHDCLCYLQCSTLCASVHRLSISVSMHRMQRHLGSVVPPLLKWTSRTRGSGHSHAILSLFWLCSLHLLSLYVVAFLRSQHTMVIRPTSPSEILLHRSVLH